MKKIFVFSILMIVLLSACGAPAPTAAPAKAPAAATEAPAAAVVDTKVWYRLTNQSLGDSLAIDIINVGTDSHALQMAKVGQFSGQFWKFIPASDGSYQMTNMFLAEKNMMLDVRDDGRAIMEKAGDDATQHWVVTHLANGAYRLTRKSSGDGFSLSISNDGRNKFVMAKTADDKLQYWTLTSIGPVQ